MKIKKYNNYIKEKFDLSIIYDLDDEELMDMLNDLNTDIKDLELERSAIYNLLKSRKEALMSKTLEEYPESIFDLSKEQLNIIFGNNNSTTKSQYEKSHQYFHQLTGVMDSGYNKLTDQFYFKICTNYFYDDDHKIINLKEGVKSIEFLGNNLKKENGRVG